MEVKALYAGSFDPLTLGHLDIIERAASIFDSVTVGVIVNPGKNSLFTLEERVQMVRNATAGISNVKVESFKGLLADYVNDQGFSAVVRGLRNSADFEYELQMANVNAKLYQNNTQTVFLMTSPELSYISSSMVREVASLGGNIESFVPAIVNTELIKKYGGNL